MKTSRLFLFIFFIVLTSLGWGQTADLPEPQMDAGPGGPPPPGLVVPIDTNRSILLIAGIFLGIYFLLLSRKNSLSAKQ